MLVKTPSFVFGTGSLFDEFCNLEFLHGQMSFILLMWIYMVFRGGLWSKGENGSNRGENGSDRGDNGSNRSENGSNRGENGSNRGENGSNQR